MRSVGVAGLALVMLAACQTGADTSNRTAAAAAPPADAELADYAPPPVGTTWAYDQDGEPLARARLADGEYDGQTFIRLDAGDGTTAFLDPASWNWVVSLDADGKPTTSVTPNVGIFRWPLWIGKEWTSTVTWRDHKRGRSWSGAQTTWKVEAIEVVETPAGAFKTYRLQSSPGRHDATRQTLWFAPDLGVYAKRRFRRTANHYLGVGGYDQVLTSYTRPEN
ncbi:MAG: hypothetical protein MI806_03910 [Minwuiales bacterium]|nr:hypothetical protein [Minwuiales bacterium]